MHFKWYPKILVIPEIISSFLNYAQGGGGVEKILRAFLSFFHNVCEITLPPKNIS